MKKFEIDFDELEDVDSIIVVYDDGSINVISTKTVESRKLQKEV